MTMSDIKFYYLQALNEGRIEEAAKLAAKADALNAKRADMAAWQAGGPKPAWLEEQQRQDREYVDNVVDL